MTRAEFAAQLKQKYPQYAAIPDDQLVAKMLEKYPVYKGQMQAESALPPQQIGTDSNPIYEDGVVPPSEPSNYLSGFVKSIKDQFLGATVNNPMVQGAAAPQSMGDFLSLVIPNVGSAAKNLGGMAVDAAKRAIPEIENVGGMRILRPVKAMGKILAEDAMSPTPRSQRTFNRMPLAEQMDYLPERAAPVRTRQGTILRGETPEVTPTPSPVDRYSPNVSGYDPAVPPAEPAMSMGPTSEALKEMPLSDQMEHLPETGPAPSGRQGMPIRGETPEAPPDMETLLDRYMSNKSADPSTVADQIEALPRSPQAEVDDVFDRYMSNESAGPSVTSPAETGALPQSPQASVDDVVLRNKDYSAAPNPEFTPGVNDYTSPAESGIVEPVDSPAVSLEDTMTRMSQPDSPTMGMPRVTSWKPGMGPSPVDVAKLRALEGTKDAAKRLAIPQKAVEELAPTAAGGTKSLPPAAQFRIQQAMSQMSPEAKAAYLANAKNPIARDYIQSLITNE